MLNNDLASLPGPYNGKTGNTNKAAVVFPCSILHARVEESIYYR